MIKGLIIKIKSDAFFRRYAVYFTGSMIVAVLNYLFYPVLGRLLSPSDFGDVQVFISIIAETGIVFGAFSIVAVNITANVEDARERNAILSELRKVCLYIAGAMALALLLCLPALDAFLNLDNVYPLLGVIAALFLGVATTFRSAYLQGQSRFLELSASGAISSAGKLVFAALLVLLGIGTLGAVGGVIMASAVSLYYLWRRTSGSLDLGARSDVHALRKGAVRKELIYGILVLFASGLVTFMYTSDVLIVKHLFDPHTAGLYSGISAIAKIIFFVTGPAVGVLLATVKLKNAPRENSLVLMKSLGMSLVLGGAVLLVFWAFGDITIRALLSDRYALFAGLLPKVGAVMLLASFLNVFVNYFLALRRFFLIASSLLGVICVAVLLLAWHGTIDAILNGLLASLALLVGSFLIIYVKNHFSRSPGPQ